MADDQGRWTYDDGYTLINMVSGDCHYAPIEEFGRINGLFETGVFKTISCVDVFGAPLSIRTDRIESIEQQSAASLASNERANAFEKANKQNPSWLDS